MTHSLAVTFVESIFGGQLISTIICSECNTVSTTTEPILDISLPIPTRYGGSLEIHGEQSKMV